MTSTLSCVEPGSFLTLHYRLAGPHGDIINTFGGKPATLSLGCGELSPAFEQRLLGMHEGQRAVFELPAGAAFGQRQSLMQQWVTHQRLRQMGATAESYQAGDVVQFTSPDGQGGFAGTVVQLGKDAGQGVLFDFNHPLAGQPVVFEVQLIGVL